MGADRAIVSGSGIGLTLAVLLILGSLAVATSGYRRALAVTDYGRWLPWGMLALRLGALVLLVLLVVNPILRIDRTPKEAQRVAILVDTSKSMAVPDSVGGNTRLEAATRILGAEKLVDRLASVARVELHAFDEDTRPAQAEALSPAGDASDLAGAVLATRQAKDPVPLAAVLLLTDGCETGAKSLAELPSSAPLYPVGLGSVDEAVAQIPDVAVSGIKADRHALINTRVEVRVELREKHLKDETVTVQLLKGDAVLAQQAARLSRAVTEVSLFLTPREAGLFEFEARVLPVADEKIVENNSRFFALKVAAQKVRVFYYEGTPRWTYKFLTRELKRDPHLSLQSVLRTGGDRAYQSASGGPEGTLFPSGRDALRRYDCVILGDVLASDFTREQAAALQAWVSDDGGGLILLAGKDAFSPSGLPAMGLEPLLPAALGEVREVAGSFPVQATPEGITHPALARMTKYLPVESLFAVGPLKAGAQLLAVAETDRGRVPLAAAQRYGAGRVFLCATDSDWKWIMKHRDRGGEELFTRFWGQAVRWAANRQSEGGSRNPLVLLSDKEIYRFGEIVRLTLQGAGAEDLTEARAAGEAVPLQPNLDQKVGTFLPRKPGLFTASAGDAECQFFVERTAGEFDRIALNESLLRQAASSSGGQYFDAITAQTLPEALRKAGRLRVETIEFVFAESWLPFLAALLALGAEWGLRKRMQVI
jgi:uncharacterized membrane protein